MHHMNAGGGGGEHGRANTEGGLQFKRGVVHLAPRSRTPEATPPLPHTSLWRGLSTATILHYTRSRSATLQGVLKQIIRDNVQT
jgi:hypothetical protein